MTDSDHLSDVDRLELALAMERRAHMEVQIVLSDERRATLVTRLTAVVEAEREVKDRVQKTYGTGGADTYNLTTGEITRSE